MPISTEPGPPRAPAQKPPSRGRRAVYILIYVVALVLFTETAARALLRVRAHVEPRPAASGTPDPEAAARALGLDPYEMIDPRDPSNWRLRPGLRMTLADVIDAKRRDGHLLAVSYLEARAPALGVRRGDIAVAIDADGYRGPEVDHAHARFRIVAIGDSCTFGTTLGEGYPYPRVMESELRRMGRDVEVINAGVEGYGPANVLARLDELEALRPELVTIYIGWNALYSETVLPEAVLTARRGLAGRSSALRLLGDAYDKASAALDDPRHRALLEYQKPKHPDRSAPDVAALDQYTPSFLPQLHKVIDGFRSMGSRVVLVTLPGLYVMDEAPDARTLEKGHLPPFTDNPYVLARMAERYNDGVRALARSRGLQVIDLDAWGRKALEPRADRFFDSVHLYEEGQRLIGARLAEALAPDVPARARPQPPAQPHRPRSGRPASASRT
jgi:lysophospholipase L1-like esterase